MIKKFKSSKVQKFKGFVLIFLCLLSLNLEPLNLELSFAATGCSYPSTLDTFPNVSTGQILTAADYNKIQCAVEQLEAADEGDSARNRHLDVYVALAAQATGGLLGPQQGRLMRQVELELENVLAAHAWSSHAAAGRELGLRLVTGLYRYWINCALLSPRPRTLPAPAGAVM